MLLTHIVKKFSRPPPHVLAILRKRSTIDILHGMVRLLASEHAPFGNSRRGAHMAMSRGFRV